MPRSENCHLIATPIPLCSRISAYPAHSRFYNFASVAFKQRDELFILVGWNFEMVESVGSVPERGLPFGGGDAEPGMRRLHVAARLNARPTGKFARLADKQLAPAPDGIEAPTTSKAREYGVCAHAAEKFIDDCSNGVVAAKSFIRGFPRFRRRSLHRMAPFQSR